ncbi:MULTISPECIES: hypothetical protein [Salinibaculum]|uniref:Nmad3 family putative nucleotide modification protein n=1 Tax=Salinibaculum TaxID=2732368 RepID=UPI0030D3BD87
MRAIAINVGANTNEPGFRAPVRPDGTFEYVPIPESEPARDPPTYGDLAPHLDTPIPDDLRATPVHLDPEFPEYPHCERYTYGDEHGIKAGPLSGLAAGDYVFFYATLSVTDPAPWLPPAWGAFLIGHFRLAQDAITGEEYARLTEADRAPFANNAHVRRETVDARVFLLGDPDESRLYERVLPLSRPTGGTDASPLVTALSSDSGKGPWWRRPLRFDERATRRLLALRDSFAHGLSEYHG